jgi:hypothetical protein
MKVCISKGVGNIFDFFYFEKTDIFIFHNVLMIWNTQNFRLLVHNLINKLKYLKMIKGIKWRGGKKPSLGSIW